ncbi:amidohydrolase family protein [uncultured Veillonella sp.]|uniref:amidohydrolase family protein n=1 Tax=uncultured Veillonella sp. TaxID=159268 RepID=UPI0025F82F5A|nr:amidohydrolase family protein [uncultured Veillonella sp.]MDY3973085.1 amidohydrolase family protein [Veillonella caviae]
MKQRDILITNGYVIDPKNGVKQIRDIYIKDGRIVGDKELLETPLEINATGLIVTPGLIDFHAHVFPKVTEIGLEPDLYFIPQGVTTVVDPGSSGVSNVQSFIENVVIKSKIRVFALLNVCSTGLGTMQFHENVDPKYWDLNQIKKVFEMWPNIIKGLKIRFSKNLVGDLEERPLVEAEKLARTIGTHLAVHTTDAPLSQGSVASILKTNDIFVHCFQGTGNTILDDNQQVLEEVKVAQEKGVIMDASNGGNHWSFDVASKAIKDGFMPDIISTDLTIKTIFKDPVFSLPYIMSKYLALGCSLESIIERCTLRPAQWLNLADEIGHLGVGAIADIAVFSLEKRKITFSDTRGVKKEGQEILTPQLTIVGGDIVYRGLSSV